MGSTSMASGERGGADGENVRWSYREIIEEGSDELKAILEIITGGHTPGIAKEEQYEN